MRVKAIKYSQVSKFGGKLITMTARWMEYRQGIIDNIVDWVIPNKFEREGIEHTLLGKFRIVDDTIKFQGKGFHSPHTLKRGMDDNIIEVWSLDKKTKYSKYSDIPVDSNGVRNAFIKKTEAYAYKSFFPDNWSDQDIINAIVEASGSPIDSIEFFSYVTRKGKTIPIRGYYKSGTNLIDTGFPVFTP